MPPFDVFWFIAGCVAGLLVAGIAIKAGPRK